MFERNERASISILGLCSLVILLSIPSFSALGLPDVDNALEDSVNALDDSVGSLESVDGQAEVDTAATASGQDSGGGAVAGHLSKFSIHGYLTQAYAKSRFAKVPVLPLPPPPFGPGGVGPFGISPDGNEESLGIPEDGTTNYRFLALQFRYEMSPKDVFVVQFSSRTLGFSGIQQFEDEIELDWAFYERRLGDSTSLKIGRVQIPFGIYNEYRDVGTLLPFYRPAFIRYKEATFTSETVDGLSLGHEFFSDNDWNLDAVAYAGEWESIQFVPNGGEDESGVVRAKKGYGFQLWLNTPLPDFRIGGGLLSFEVQSDLTGLQNLERRNIWHASLDATFGRVTFQAEWDDESSLISFGGLESVIDATDWYVLAGVRVTEKFRIWGQYERGDFKLSANAFLYPLEWTGRIDRGVSLNYSFTPSLVLKAEYHWTEQDLFQFFPDFSTGAFFLRPETARADGGNYTIISFSVAF